MVREIAYNIVVQGKFGDTVEIDWGKTPRWAEVYREQLNNAVIIMLNPKPGISLPTVSIRVMPGQRWIIFSRVVGVANTDISIRLHCIGRQETIAGKTVKTLLWIYPDGDIQVADTPGFAEFYLQQLRRAA